MKQTIKLPLGLHRSSFSRPYLGLMRLINPVRNLRPWASIEFGETCVTKGSLKYTFCNHLKHGCFHQNKGKPPFTSCNVQVFLLQGLSEAQIFRVVFSWLSTQTDGSHFGDFSVRPHRPPHSSRPRRPWSRRPRRSQAAAARRPRPRPARRRRRVRSTHRDASHDSAPPRRQGFGTDSCLGGQKGGVLV